MSTQLTLSEAAKRLKVSEKSIRRYIKAGRMRANLIKGQKGYEYRIDAKQLKVLEKPPRGKNSHRNKKIRKEKTKKPSSEISIKQINLHRQISRNSTTGKLKKISKPTKNKTKKKSPVKPLQSVGEIIRKKIEKKNASGFQLLKQTKTQNTNASLIDYKTLYENLLLKYEQTLIMLGALEAQISSKTTPVNSGKIEKMEDSIAKQEEIIMDLYQTLQLYKSEGNY